MEKAIARMMREAGYRVAENQLLRDTNLVSIDSNDRRQLEVVAYNGPLYHGQVLCIDATLVSCLNTNGMPRPRTVDHDGAAMVEAARIKRATYHELSSSRRGRLIVFGCETGGRWNDEALELVSKLAKAKARAVPGLLRRSAQLAWANRWWSMLSVTVQKAYAQTLSEEEVSTHFADGPCPDMGDLLTDGRALDPPSPSRMPARG